MKPSDLDRIDRRLADRCRPWAKEAATRIGAKVADARAHAEKALTATARDAEDGRPTSRVIGRSASYDAALNRLDELQAALTGPDVRSAAGLVRDARAAFYDDSLALWLPFTPEEFRAVKDPAPTVAGERAARGLVLHGYDLFSEVKPTIDQAKRSLSALLNVSSRKAADPERGPRMLKAWERTAVRNISVRVLATIADSSVAVHHFVGLAMLHEDVRPDPSS